jgi:spore maturation protein CgeB
MKLVVFGLTVSSTWGNGHATLWRGLLQALARRGWHVVFFEHDVPYYAMNRDCYEIPGGELVLYSDWAEIAAEARRHVAEADAAMITSYCPHGLEATEIVLDAPRALRVLYDLDTPVTLSRLGRGDATTYIGTRGLAGFDLVLSFTGGTALDELRNRLGAQRVAPLYGHVNPDIHRPVGPVPRFAADLSYLGTYAADRQAALDMLFVEPARQRPAFRFLIGGAQYPDDFPWSDNIYFVRHLPPDQHPEFYASSRLTMNVTREAMAAMGWCPSGRLFEAAACGAAIISDWWPGLEEFFIPGEEILVAGNTADTIAALELSDAELRRIGERARARVLAEHTSERRVDELITLLTAGRAEIEPARRAVEA